MCKLIDDIVKGKGEISEVNKKLEEMLDENRYFVYRSR